MNFIAERNDLLTAVKSMIKIVTVTSKMVELRGFLIDCDEDTGEITLTATNFEASIQRKIKASVGASGSFVIDAQIFMKMLTLVDSSQISFCEESSARVEIKGNSCKYSVNVLSAKSYPRPELPFPEDTIKVSGICKLYEKTVASVANNNSTLFLTGIHLDIYSDCIEAFGCDGTRLATAAHTVDTGGKLSVTIPKSSFSYLAGAVEDGDVLNAGICGNFLVFTMQNMLFSARIITENYIDTGLLLENLNIKYTAKVNSKRLEDAITMIIACVNSSMAAKAEPRVNMRFSKNEIILTTKNAVSSSHVPIDAVISKNNMPTGGFWYNPFSFLDCFDTVEGEISLQIDESGILLAENENAKYMLRNVRPRKLKIQSEEAA